MFLDLDYMPRRVKLSHFNLRVIIHKLGMTFPEVLLVIDRESGLGGSPMRMMDEFNCAKWIGQMYICCAGGDETSIHLSNDWA